MSATVAGFSASAYAGSADEPEIEEIIVTGTHLRRGKFDMASPVEVIDAGDIETSGYTNIGPYIRDLTYTENVDTVANVLDITDGLQDSNSARFNLRGLGVSSTLTLFDGHRVINDGAVAGILPDIALQRVEVILDGGAATYGTDAVAGVVNFIPIKEYDGWKVRGYYSEDSRGDNPEPKISALWGKAFDRWNIVAAIEYSDREGLYRSDRPKYLGADNDTSTTGDPGTFTGRISPLGFAVDPHCGTFNGSNTDDSQRGSYPSGRPAIFIPIPPIPGLLPSGGVFPAVCAWEYGEFQDYLRPSDDLVGYVGATFDLTDRVKLELQLNYDKLNSTLLSSPSTGERGSNDLLTIPGSHPNNPFTDFLQPLFPFPLPPPAVTPRGWRPFGKSGATLPSHLDSHGADNTKFPYEAIIANAGLTFPLGETGWDAEVSASVQNTVLGVKGRALRRSRLEAALMGMGGPSGNEWFNPFGSASPLAADYCDAPAGQTGPGGCTGTANTQSLVDWLYTPYDYDSIETDYWTIEGVVSGTIAHLPAGDLLMAFGGQYRKTQITDRENPVNKIVTTISGMTTGDNYNAAPVNPPAEDSQGESAVRSVFFEAEVPLLTGLSMNVAGRYEDFTDLDLDQFVPKVSLRYTPVDQLSLRASYGEGFLAPTINQITPDPTPDCTELFAGDDPFLTPFESQGANPDLTSALSCTSGNAELQPEESDIWNIGFTWLPLQDLEISLDYQEIEYTDRIVRLGTVDTLRRDLAAFLQANNLTQAQYEALTFSQAQMLQSAWYASGSDPNITRDSTGDVIQVVRIPGNVAVVNVNVIDFRLNYSTGLGDYGFLNANLAHTQYTTYDYEDAFGTLVDAVGRRNGDTDVVPPIPDYRTNLRLSWLKNNHTIGATVKYTPSMDFDGSTGPSFVPGAFPTPEKLDSYTTVDVRYSYLFENLWGGSLGLALGSNNVFDEDAQPLPVLGGLATRIQSPLGRTYYLEFTYTAQ